MMRPVPYAEAPVLMTCQAGATDCALPAEEFICFTRSVLNENIACGLMR